jgi:hypothetical protein
MYYKMELWTQNGQKIIVDTKIGVGQKLWTQNENVDTKVGVRR